MRTTLADEEQGKSDHFLTRSGSSNDIRCDEQQRKGDSRLREYKIS